MADGVGCVSVRSVVVFVWQANLVSRDVVLCFGPAFSGVTVLIVGRVLCVQQMRVEATSTPLTAAFRVRLSPNCTRRTRTVSGRSSRPFSIASPSTSLTSTSKETTSVLAYRLSCVKFWTNMWRYRWISRIWFCVIDLSEDPVHY